MLSRFADTQAVSWRGAEVLTWGRFRADVAASAAAFAGCRRGALVCGDSYRFAVGLFALLAAGARVVVPANLQPGTLAALAGAFDRLVDDDALAPAGADAWHCPVAGVVEFHTSGSTGPAKTVERTLAQLEGEVAALQARFGEAAAGGAAVATVPHRHVYGLAFKLLWPLASGRPFAAATHDLWEGLLSDLPAGAVVVSSPAHLTRLGGLAPLPPDSRPRMVLSAGAPLPPDAALEAWRIFGVPPTEIYGSTETGAVATRRLDEPWRPLPGNRLTVTGTGGLELVSPYVLDGRRVEMADRAEPAEGGGFRLLGRLDRVAKIEGKRIDLAEVEDHLRALDDVDDAAILVLAEDRHVLAAVVRPSAPGWAELGRLGRFHFGRRLRRALAATQEPAGLPRRWRFVERMPVDSMGKRPAALLAALFAEARRLPRVLATRRGCGTAECDLAIDADLMWFHGHFPGTPILPGVVQIDWALHFARACLGLALDTAPVFRVKFKAVIVPGDVVTLALDHDRARGRLSFEFRRGAKICTGGSIALGGGG